ncbi:MAG: GNAT family N-acetyltransferase [Acidobacteriota bacterium]
MAIAIDIETPLQDEVRALVAELNAVLLELTPPEHCHHLTVEQMADDSTTVFIAREDGAAVACGALKRHADGIGEVKRMYTQPSHRGRKIGEAIVARIEALARSEGLKRLVLETGDRHHAAWKVYERSGFTRCGAVLDYPDVTWSVFYEKNLGG